MTDVSTNLVIGTTTETTTKKVKKTKKKNKKPKRCQHNECKKKL